MIKYTACAALGLIAGVILSAAPDPLQPPKAVKILTEVGSVATSSNKAEVSVVGSISRTGRDFQVLVSDADLFGGRSGITLRKAPAVAEALRMAGEALRKGEPFPEMSIGSTRIYLSSLRDDPYVVLRIPEERHSLGATMVHVDADNADALAQLIDRAVRIAAWIDARTGEIRYE